MKDGNLTGNLTFNEKCIVHRVGGLLPVSNQPSCAFRSNHAAVPRHSPERGCRKSIPLPKVNSYRKSILHARQQFSKVNNNMRRSQSELQGYLADKKPSPPLAPPQEPRHGPTAGSYGVAVSYKRGTPVPPPAVWRALEVLCCERKQGFSADPFYGRARCSLMLGKIKT